jgi:hypothetical protein
MNSYFAASVPQIDASRNTLPMVSLPPPVVAAQPRRIDPMSLLILTEPTVNKPQLKNDTQSPQRLRGGDPCCGCCTLASCFTASLAVTLSCMVRIFLGRSVYICLPLAFHVYKIWLFTLYSYTGPVPCHLRLG